MVWGARKRGKSSIQKVLQNLWKTINNVLLKHLCATRLRFTNLILTSGGDQNIDAVDASNVVFFSIDFYKILIPTLGRNQNCEFQRDGAHVGLKARFLILVSSGDQDFDKFEGDFRYNLLTSWNRKSHISNEF